MGNVSLSSQLSLCCLELSTSSEHPRTMGHNDWDYERKPYQMVQKEDTSPERHWSEVRVSFRYLLVAEPLDKLGYVFHTGNITGASPLGFMGMLFPDIPLSIGTSSCELAAPKLVAASTR
ncbi:hypothetical protein EDD16DRAFT_1717004 [Pisolithus croceorrhizus]|nr:hypothetical protein EDD16DRAFT_1717004 [Pisolithus croceorrhizus]